MKDQKGKEITQSLLIILKKYLMSIFFNLQVVTTQKKRKFRRSIKWWLTKNRKLKRLLNIWSVLWTTQTNKRISMTNRIKNRSLQVSHHLEICRNLTGWKGNPKSLNKRKIIALRICLKEKIHNILLNLSFMKSLLKSHHLKDLMFKNHSMVTVRKKKKNKAFKKCKNKW